MVLKSQLELAAVTLWNVLYIDRMFPIVFIKNASE